MKIFLTILASWVVLQSALAQQPLLLVNKPLQLVTKVDGKVATFTVLVAPFRNHFGELDKGSYYWGMEVGGNRRPETMVKSLTATYDSMPIYFPMTAVECLAEPTSMRLFGGKNGIFKAIIGLSDASGSMDVIFTFDHDELIRREVYDEIHNLCEDIHYPHYRYANAAGFPDWSRWQIKKDHNLVVMEGNLTVDGGGDDLKSPFPGDEWWMCLPKKK